MDLGKTWPVALFMAASMAYPRLATAAPYIDPELRPLMADGPLEAAAGNSPIRAIVKFKDAQPLPKLAPTAENHREIELAMIRNARASQAAAARFNDFQNRQDSGQGQAQSQTLWLFNAAIVDMPGNRLRAFSAMDGIEAIFANRAAQLSKSPRAVATAFAPGAALPTSHAGPLVKSLLASPAAPLDEGLHYTEGMKLMQLPGLRQLMPDLSGTGVKVGIIDSGIDASHSSLAGRLLLYKDFTATAKAEPSDENGHGTHVSGTIAASSGWDFRLGVAPEARLIVAKVFDPAGNADDAALLKAMQWMADPDGDPNTNDFPSVVNNSWGDSAPDASLDPSAVPGCQAVAAWAKLGMLPVFAAGNHGPDAQTGDLPSSCPDALSVGAIDKDGNVAPFSGRGPATWKAGPTQKPQVMAYGMNVLSTVPGGSFATKSGTSMAAPHVAGLAALYYQLHPKASVGEAVKAMTDAAAPMGDKTPNYDSGYGRANALKVFSGGAPSQPAPAPPIPTDGEG